MKWITIGCWLICSASFAHDSTDWRTDSSAFLSARVVQNQPNTGGSVFRVFPENISMEYLKQKLSEFSGAIPTVVDGQTVTISERQSAKGRELSLRYLIQEYQALGFKVTSHQFSSGVNFIAERTGSDPGKVLILSSHIDSVGNAGANDDGAGTISVLAVAQSLKNLKLTATLRVLGFDREEVGLVGSAAYVKSLPSLPAVIGNIQLEMMATNHKKDGRFHVIDCDRPESTGLSAQIMNAVVALKLPLQRVAACTTRSDHASFWSAKLPAIVLSENFFGGDGDPCYHAQCDKADARLDFEYMANITAAVALASANILGARTK